MNKFFVATAAVSALAVSPAAAAPVIIDLTGTATSTSGADGLGITRSGTSGGTSVKVRASGWSYDGTTVRDSYIAAYTGGLGVTSDNETGGSNTHTIDNDGWSDFVLLQFDQAVQLTTATFNTYSVKGGTKDSDAFIGYGTVAVPYTSQLALNNTNASTLMSMLTGTFSSDGDGAGGSRSLGTPSNAYGNLWLVSAAITNPDRYTDGFKLSGITVKTLSPVPEPATWAMMITGFGMVGASLRYRRRKIAVAFG